MDIARIIRKEKEAHERFFGRVFDLSKFTKDLEENYEKLVYWDEYGLEPHFFPDVVMDADAKFPGWKEKPHPNFFRVAPSGMIHYLPVSLLYSGRKSLHLGGRSILVDMRRKPYFDNGNQKYENDILLGPVLSRLRKEGKIGNFIISESRFVVSPQEWDKTVKPVLAKQLDIPEISIRFERIIEAHLIPQIYLQSARVNDPKTDTWVWNEEYYPTIASRTCGLSSTHGGLRHVTWSANNAKVNFIGIRPIINL